MQPMPLVGVEISRINDAFQKVSLDLAGVLSSLRDVEIDGVGTPSCDQAVVAGMTDLRTALSGLEHVATECVTALGRHAGAADAAPATNHRVPDPGRQP